jgi:predicted DNA binding protein
MESLMEEPYHVSVEVENQDCRGLEILEKSGVEKYSLVDIRGAPRAPTRHLVKTHTEGLIKLPKQFFVKHITESGKATTAWFNTEGCDVCNAILSNGSFLISAKHIKGRIIIYSFVAPSFNAYKDIISTFEKRNIKFKILEIRKFRSESTTLTEKQERVLWLALKMGFFEYPRKITMLQLSKRLGVGLSSLSEILRRGMRRLTEDHFDS